MGWTTDHLNRTETLSGYGPFEVVRNRVTVVFRYCGEDTLWHAYRAEHVDTRDGRDYLVAVCQENAFFPVRHDPSRVGRTDLPLPDADHACRSCGVWLRNTPHVMLQRGRVA